MSSKFLEALNKVTKGMYRRLPGGGVENLVTGAHLNVVKVYRKLTSLCRAQRLLAMASWLQKGKVATKAPAPPKKRLSPVAVWGGKQKLDSEAGAAEAHTAKCARPRQPSSEAWESAAKRLYE